MTDMITALLLTCCTSTVGCEGHPGMRDDAASLVARAQQFRALVQQDDHASARLLMAPDPRRWWGTRDGEGRPWRIGPEAHESWAAWDDYFRSEKQVVNWKEDPGSVTALVRETNDYYLLLERGSVLNEVTYYFDGSGRIEGLLIRGVGARPRGKTSEFVAWALKNDPEELKKLMPGGEIDPSGDHPQRFRLLLNRWRQASGRDPAGIRHQ